MFLAFLSILVLGLTFAAFNYRIWWCEILDFFRLQLAGTALLFFMIALIKADYFSIALTLTAMAVNIYRIRHFLPHFSPGGVVQRKHVLSINAWRQHEHPEALGSVIRAANPTVLLISEISPRLEKQLAPVLNEFPHRLETPLRGRTRSRNCLFSKAELKEAKISRDKNTGAFLIHAITKINKQEWQIFTAHPKPGLTRQRQEARALLFEKIEAIAAASGLPVILMGDFGMVPWADRFRHFLKKAKLQNPLRKYGYEVTWPVNFPLLGVPMDYILISESENYRDLHMGPYTGSGHFPVSLKLEAPQETREKREMELKTSEAVG